MPLVVLWVFVPLYFGGGSFFAKTPRKRELRVESRTPTESTVERGDMIAIRNEENMRGQMGWGPRAVGDPDGCRIGLGVGDPDGCRLEILMGTN